LAQRGGALQPQPTMQSALLEYGAFVYLPFVPDIFGDLPSGAGD
jgi:hypothetical protein